jgi:electron transfer flavoprotein beta subunit
MDIIVCVKRVPDSETKIKIAPDNTSIDASGVQYIPNPYDEIAVEQALRLKESEGGEVTILSLGPADAGQTIRKALAMGADKGILLIDPSDGKRDQIGIAEAMAEELKNRKFDILLLGRSAIDDQSASVGPMVAQMLGLPCVTDISTFKLEGGKAITERAFEGGREIIETTLPAVFTCQKGLAEARLAALKGIMLAKKKPLEEKKIPEYQSGMKVVNMVYPPQRKGGQIVGKGTEGISPLIKKLREERGII